MKSTKTAALIVAAVMALSTLLGSCRSLNAARAEATRVFEQGEYGDGVGVRSDLEKQHGVCANVRTLAQRNLPGDDAALEELGAFFEARFDPLDPDMVRAERAAAVAALDRMGELNGLDEKDRGYLSDLRAQLASLERTIAHDPYTAMAEEFNTRTLGAFPANILGALTGVKPLPEYR